MAGEAAKQQVQQVRRRTLELDVGASPAVWRVLLPGSRGGQH